MASNASTIHPSARPLARFQYDTPFGGGNQQTGCMGAGAWIAFFLLTDPLPLPASFEDASQPRACVAATEALLPTPRSVGAAEQRGCGAAPIKCFFPKQTLAGSDGRTDGRTDGVRPLVRSSGNESLLTPTGSLQPPQSSPLASQLSNPVST